MIRTKLAKKILTKKEQRHLTEVGIDSMKLLLQQRDHMLKMNPENPQMVCQECQHIINKMVNALREREML